MYSLIFRLLSGALVGSDVSKLSESILHVNGTLHRNVSIEWNINTNTNTTLAIYQHNQNITNLLLTASLEGQFDQNLTFVKSPVMTLLNNSVSQRTSAVYYYRGNSSGNATATVVFEIIDLQLNDSGIYILLDHARDEEIAMDLLSVNCKYCPPQYQVLS